MATTPALNQRESVPFRVRTADGDNIELAYSSPRPAEQHDERALLESLPWFESGKPLKNWMLHETDLYDEVEQIWGRRWGAEEIGTLREVLVSRPTENETRPEYAEEWQYYYSSAAGTADLGVVPSTLVRSGPPWRLGAVEGNQFQGGDPDEASP